MILVLAAVFLTTLAIALGGYIFINREALTARETARVRLGSEVRRARGSLIREDKSSDFALLNRLLSGRALTDWLKEELRRAGTGMTVGAFLILAATLVLAGALLGWRSGGPLLAAVLALLAAGSLFLWLGWRKRKRLAAFEAQLPDAIDMIVAAMKAGYSFQAATEFIGEEIGEPLAGEFGQFYDEQRLGIDVRTALLNLQERVDSIDLKMFVTAILIQRESGGNLSEILSKLADLVRERITMRGKIETLVAEPKLSARMLAVLPVMVFLVLSLIAPQATKPLIETEMGRVMLMAAGASVALGYWIMIRIADVDL